MATTTTDPQLYPGWTNQGQTGDNESSGTAATAGLSGLTNSNKDPQFVTGWTNQSGTGDNQKGAGPDVSTVTTPAMPLTGVLVTNNTGVPVDAYFMTAAAATTIAINGVNVLVTSATAGPVSIGIPMGGTIKITASTMPASWVWMPGI